MIFQNHRDVFKNVRDDPVKTNPPNKPEYGYCPGDYITETLKKPVILTKR